MNDESPEVLSFFELVRKANALFRKAVRHRDELLKKKKPCSLNLVTLDEAQAHKLRMLSQARVQVPTAFGLAEKNAIRRWKDGNVRKFDIAVLEACYSRHLGPDRMVGKAS